MEAEVYRRDLRAGPIFVLVLRSTGYQSAGVAAAFRAPASTFEAIASAASTSARVRSLCVTIRSFGELPK